MRNRGIAASLFLLLSSVILSGCATSFAPGPETPVDTAFGPISGYSYGGQQPIAGAAVEALQTSVTAYGGASSVLATTSTDAKGYFSFPASTTCTSGRVVYLYSLGGQPTTGVTNAAAGEMAVLGICPTDGLLVNAVVAAPATSAQIFINEVSTVAAAYALAGFATSATAIGNTGTTLGNTGIQNAANNAAQMYTAVATSGGGVTNNGGVRAALATTPNGNGTVPQALIDTLANILAACINSASPFTPCTTLFNDARSGGGQTGTQATDTATAAIYLAQHPYSGYVTTLFNLVGSTANPFTPALTTAPNDFAVALLFTASLNGPYGIAIDASGDAWISNSGGVYVVSPFGVVKLSPLGVPASGSPFQSTASNEPLSVAIDLNGNVWVSNDNANNVLELNSAGGLAGTYATDIANSYGIAIDASNNVWVANTGDSVTKISNTSGTATFTTLGDSKEPYFLTISSAGVPWVSEVAAGVSQYNSADTSATYFDTTGVCSGQCKGLAGDSSGYIWGADQTAGAVDKISNAGASVASTSVPLTPQFLAVDGANNVWVSTASNSSGTFAAGTAVYGIVELSSADAVVGPPATVGYTAGGKLQVQRGIAVDGSGDLWVANENYYNTSGTELPGTTVVEFLGLATPVVTPLNPSQLSTKP